MWFEPMPKLAEITAQPAAAQAASAEAVSR